MTADAVRGSSAKSGRGKEMGASFGVFSLRGYTLDIALPRHGGGKGEDADIDPFMGRKEAERRRDFTMNAMMQDVLTGEIFDDFDGREDIRKRVIRHVDEETFRRDPLRAMRAAQFARGLISRLRRRRWRSADARTARDGEGTRDGRSGKGADAERKAFPVF